MKSILYVQYTNPGMYPPLDRSSRILGENGWRVHFLGIDSLGDSNQLKLTPHPNVSVTSIGYCSPGIRQKLHYLYWMWLCLWHAVRNRSSVIYLSDLLSYPVGYMLAKCTRAKLIMHEHDPPTDEGGRIQKMLLWFRRRVAKLADVCVVPQEQRAEDFKRELNPRRLMVVFNCPSKSELGIAREPQTGHLKLWFHGSIVPTQMPMAILEAIRNVQQPIEFGFAGYETIGHRGYVEEFLQRASQLGLRERVHYHGALETKSKLQEIASSHHVGVALFSKKFRAPMVGASNKPFDYLACGLALLVPETPEWCDFFVSRQCAVACDSEDPRSIGAAIEALCQSPELLKQLAANGQKMLYSEWNYEYQFRECLHFLESQNA